MLQYTEVVEFLAQGLDIELILKERKYWLCLHPSNIITSVTSHQVAGGSNSDLSEREETEDGGWVRWVSLSQ